MASKPRKPSGLGDAGAALWADLVGPYEFRPDELRVLEAACREVDLIAAMEAELQGADFTVRGSQGQPVANPMLGELRQHRALLDRLLRSLALPDEEGRAATQRSESARAAANARWRRPA